ncbi:hypothetical protein JAAARDRAFT_38068 [Jaapia argillacea MUCL 33604]|uniref:Uncharacterized protein n=1 Tax=Jaapia argillacea MUCL 33604 TaxID=933084 RepID=A0A067PX96_9AGAM|nr:hypothetical protein JAAARDRAFT_38068 [Jaapia argillacea MUCL 33604]
MSGTSAVFIPAPSSVKASLKEAGFESTPLEGSPRDRTISSVVLQSLKIPNSPM